MGNVHNLIGRKFDRLEVIARAGSRVRPGHTDALWLCRCKCGNEVVVLSQNLLHNHNTRSCGCLMREASSQRMKAIHKRRWGGNDDDQAAGPAAGAAGKEAR